MLNSIYIIITGILFIISLAKPDLYFLTWIAFLPLFAALKNSNPKEAFYNGLCLGIVIMGGSAYWLYYPLIDFSGFPELLIIFILILFFLVMGLFYALGILIFIYINGNKEIHPLVFAVCWTAIEYLRFKIIPFFPLGFTAYTQTGFKSMLQLADIGGIFLVSFIVALISAYIYKFIKNKNFKYLIPVFIIITLVLSYGNYQLKYYENKEYKTISTGIVNTMIAQKDKWKSSWIEKNIDEFISTALQFKDVDLIIGPETSLTFDIIRNEYYREQFFKKSTGINSYLQVGSQSIKENEKDKYNSIFLISPDDKLIDRYNKRLLVPFGEYIPFHEKFNILNKIKIQSLSKGEKEIIFKAPFAEWATSICSEIMYPLIYSSEFDFMVNHSNEAWYRESNIKQQMWSAAVFRAVEYRCSVVKSGNHSWSGLISPSGNTGEIFKNGEDVIVNIKINKENTLYQQWKNFVGWGALLLVILALLIRLFINRK